MKKILLFLPLFVCSFALFAEDNHGNTLGGSGKTYREYQTLRYDGDGTILGYAVHAYNGNGLKTESRWYNEHGNYQMVVRYEYDNQKRLVKESLYDPGESFLFSYTVHDYDDSGRKISSIDYNSEDEKIFWIQYSRNFPDTGVAREEYGFSGDGTQVFRVENIIGKEGLKTGSQVFNITNEGEAFSSHGVYTYDGSGNLLKTEIFSPEDELLWYTEHKWERAE